MLISPTSLNLLNTKKPTLLWKYLKETMAVKFKSNIKYVLIDGQIITGAKCKANAFNNI